MLNFTIPIRVHEGLRDVEAAIIGAAIGVAGLIIVTGISAIVRLQYQILERVADHHEQFLEFRAGTHERVNALESRIRGEDRVSATRALEQVSGLNYGRRASGR